MSTFLILIVQMLADMGVPMMREVEQHLGAPPADVPAHRVPARGAVSQARTATEPEWQKRPKEFDPASGISNGF
jgi:hypothetical protein